MSYNVYGLWNGSVKTDCEILISVPICFLSLWISLTDNSVTNNETICIPK